MSLHTQDLTGTQLRFIIGRPGEAGVPVATVQLPGGATMRLDDFREVARWALEGGSYGAAGDKWNAPWNAPPHPSRDCEGEVRMHLLSLRAEVEEKLDADDINLTVSCSRCHALGTASLVYDHIDWEREQP